MAFDLTGIGSLADFAKGVLDRVIPDPTAKAAAQMAVDTLAQNGQLAQLAADTDLAKGQLAVDQAEAGNANLFVSGWRPGVGWICCAGLGYQFIIAPMMTWASTLIGHAVAAPSLDMSTLLTLLLGMLGLGGMRTVEKLNGVASK